MLLFLVLLVLIEYVMYLLGLIEQVAYGLVVVKSVNYVCNVFTKVNLFVPLSFKKFGSSVNKVSSEYLGKYPFLVSLVHILKTVAEEAKGGKYENTICTLILELLSDVDYGIAGGNHIVNNNNVLISNVTTEIFVSNDGVLTVYYN